MNTRPRLAVLTPVYFYPSHSDVIVTRWLDPLPSDRQFGWPAEGHDKPRSEIASLYIEQFPENDKGREIAAKYNVPLFSSIRDTLTLGTDKLVVDGVLLIGEHGDFPYNKWGQQMYPRREYFDEIVKVFRDSGRAVPVFLDKHLSYDDASAIHIVKTAREMGFPLMAGSSAPIQGVHEPEKIPQDPTFTEVVGIYYEGMERYGYHSIAFVESIVARRKSGESGIESVTAYAGDSFWQAQKEGKWPVDLFERALQTVTNANPGDWQDNLTAPKAGEPFHDKWPAAYCFTHRDGFRSTYINLNGHIEANAFAARSADGSIYADRKAFIKDTREKFFPHFAMFDARIEEFMLTGKSPYPVEHYLLTTLAIAAAVRALAQPGKMVKTPQIDMSYRLE